MQRSKTELTVSTFEAIVDTVNQAPRSRGPGADNGTATASNRYKGVQIVENLQARGNRDKWASWRERYGPWAVVTGASSGIGLEFAKALAEMGLNLVLVARRREVLESLGRELEERFAIETRVCTADLSVPEDRQGLLELTQGLDVGLLVANAGYGLSGPFLASDLEDGTAMIDVNVRAVVEQAYYFAHRFRQRDSSGIILLSSILSWQGVPGAAAYAASKAFIQSFAEALHKELKPAGIDVLSSAPAQVASGFNARANLRSPGTDPAIVVRNSLRALGKQQTAYGHFRSWFLSTALAFLPRRVRVVIMQSVMAGMTAHQQMPAAHRAT